MKASIAKISITPLAPLRLHGWAGIESRARPFQRVSQDIFVKTLVLQDASDETYVLITADLLGFTEKMVSRVARAILASYQIDRSHVLMVASHNHSGPAVDDLLHLYLELSEDEAEKVQEYTHWLERQIVQSVGEALASLQEVELSFGIGLAGIGVNRRRARSGGRHLPTIVDQDVPVLKMTTPEGEVVGVMFGYACHTTTIEDGSVNGDYAGYAQQFIEEMYPGAVAMFVAGCGGDINPLPRFHPGLVEMYGRILAVAVEDVIASEMLPISGDIRAGIEFPSLSFASVPSKSELEALLPGREGLRLREIENLIGVIDRTGGLPSACEYAVQVLRIGERFKLIALSGEPVCDYAMRFKNEYGWDSTWVCGYAGPLVAYIPSSRVLQEGGYEGGLGMMEYGLPGEFSADVEEKIAAAVANLSLQTDSSRGEF